MQDAGENNALASVEDADIEDRINHHYLQMHQAHIFRAGFKYFSHFLDGVFGAVEAGHPGGVRDAVKQAVTSGVPEGLVKMALDAARDGYEELALFREIARGFNDASTAYMALAVRATPEFIDAALTGADHKIVRSEETGGTVRHIRAGKLLDNMLACQWQGGRLPVVFGGRPLVPADARVLNLADYISEDGTIYYDLLAQGLSTFKKDALCLTGLGEALLKCNENILRPSGLNLAIGLVALVQGYALDAPAERQFQPQDIAALAAGILGRNASSGTRVKFNIEKLADRTLAEKIKMVWQAIDLKSKKRHVMGAAVYLDGVSSFAPFHHYLNYLPDPQTGDMKACLSPLLEERLRDWGYENAARADILHVLAKGASPENVACLKAVHRDLLSYAPPAAEGSMQIAGALQSAVLGYVMPTVELAPETSLRDMKRYFIAAYGAGLFYIDLYRVRSGWDEPLLAADILPEEPACQGETSRNSRVS